MIPVGKTANTSQHKHEMKISGNIVDVLNSVIYAGTLEIRDGVISNIIKETQRYDTYILPGFVDAHVHVESSLLTPSEFARIAVTHGTVASVSDPHEIANVLGIEGVWFMIEDAGTTPFTFCFGAPSCVPATPFEISGGRIGITEMETLFKRDETAYLSEMMNYPAVINDEPSVLAAISLAKRYGKPIDGHAPGLRGAGLKKYIDAGITTDHESIEYTEALEKINLGMKILIREGSAAKVLNTFSPLIDLYSDCCMFCSDDKHPDDLVRGHINELVRRAVSQGRGLFPTLKCACVNPVFHYGLDIGLLQNGQRADFIIVDNLSDFNVLKTVIKGCTVAERGKTHLSHRQPSTPNKFKIEKKHPSDFSVPVKGSSIHVIEVVQDQIVTRNVVMKPLVQNGYAVSDVEKDVIKLTVVDRYKGRPPAVAFVKNIGLKTGAMASSVAHDSHNIIAAGTTDEAICEAVNLIIENKGGISLVSDNLREILPLPVAGIMSGDDGFAVADAYGRLDKLAKSLGTGLSAPYMTLSFLALLVIPGLKLSDRGLFDSEHFSFIDLFL